MVNLNFGLIKGSFRPLVSRIMAISLLHNLGAGNWLPKPVSGYQKLFFDSLETAFTSSHFGDVSDKTILEICLKLSLK